MYENIIQEFQDIIDISDCFNSFSFKSAYSRLNNSKSNLIFLIGVPGSGKTFLIDYFFQNNDLILLKGIINKEELDTKLTTNKLIVIDEAQLLDVSLMEYIRILSDSKQYNFILSMHTEDAKKILAKQHFKSRNIDVIELSVISKPEMVQYVNSKLLKNGANHLFSKKEFDMIYNYTKGNFRYVKKFIKSLFELLELAHTHNLTKYQKISNCLITMNAIRLGLENG